MGRAAGARVLVAAVASVMLLSSCTDDPGTPDADSPTPSASTRAGAAGTGSEGSADATAIPVPDARQQWDAQSSAYDAAVSTPQADPVYPDVGDASVDALHYGLDLAWTPSTRTLRGLATVVFRAPADENSLRLDLAADLHVAAVTLDGQAVAFSHPGQDLVVSATVARDSRHLLEVRYAGVPRPAAAPTTRSDVATVGWTSTPTGAAWTMQEPYGAFTWYPVDDQPADKAFYDITVTTTAPFRAVANGEPTSLTVAGGKTISNWRLDQPVASYLVTVAVDDFDHTQNTSADGTEIDYWVPTGTTSRITRAVRQANSALDWVESKLGPYPFSSLGFVLVDSDSGMETQTLITLGDDQYATSMPTLVHELVHQWYGDQVTPADWSDVWMNEGMAMYLQLVWQAEHAGVTMATELAPVVREEARLRAEDGPPGGYDPSRFAEGNVYYGPALMWHALRQRIGDRRFFAVVRSWPRSHAGTSQSRDTYLPWLVRHTGVPRSFFEAWLLSPTSPSIDLGR